jgi:hypothetical protein
MPEVSWWDWWEGIYRLLQRIWPYSPGGQAWALYIHSFFFEEVRNNPHQSHPAGIERGKEPKDVSYLWFS